MIITTMRGTQIDMAQVLAQNDTAVAIGNASMNARGDIVGPGGKIVKRKEQVTKEYHQNNPNASKRVSLKELEPDMFLTPQEAVDEITKSAPPPPSKGKKIVDND